MSHRARGIFLLLIALIATVAHGGEAASTWTMPEADRLAVRAVVDRAIAAGFPDAKGGALFEGQLEIKRNVPPGKPDDEREDALATHEGLHLRLADGTWVVNLQKVVVNGPLVTVDDQHLKPVPIDQVLARAQVYAKGNGSVPFQVDGGEQEYESIAPDQRDMVRASSALEPVLTFCQYDNADIIAAHLIRLGMPQAELLAVSSSVMGFWDVAGLFWVDKSAQVHFHFNERNADWAYYGEVGDGEVLAAEGVPMPEIRRLLPAAVSMRRGLCGYFLNSLIATQDPFLTLPAERAAAGVLALIDDSDPLAAVARTRVKRLLARTVIPRKPAAGADLAARLASWGSFTNADLTNGTFGYSEKDVASLAGQPQQDLAGYPAGMREVIEDYRHWPTFTVADLDALFALAGDARPGRWLDGIEVRTVGDNALRGIAMVLGFDPRSLVKRALNAPWTDAERSATVTALTAWWAINRGRPLIDILVDAIGDLPLSDLGEVLAATDVAQRSTLLNRLAKLWAVTPPSDPSARSLAFVLWLAKGHAALDAVVAQWPLVGKTRVLLIAWHIDRGNTKPFDELFTEVLAATAVAKEGKIPVELGQVIRLASHHPSAERLQRLLTLLSAPVDEKTGEAITHAVMSILQWNEDELTRLWQDHSGSFHFSAPPAETTSDKANQAEAAIPLALLATVVNNQRPASKQQTAEVAGYTQAPFGNGGTGGKPLADDLRVADVYVTQLSQVIGRIDFDALAGKGSLQKIYKSGFDLSAKREMRDQRIVVIRRILAEALTAALHAAKLPEVLPGLTDIPVTGDDKAAF